MHRYDANGTPVNRERYAGRDRLVRRTLRHSFRDRDPDRGHAQATPTSGRSHKNVAVSVTSRTSGSWALSVGWTKTRPAADEEPATP
ncbi:hypothetical protein OHB10_25785 [Streptomyces sp. NBC_01597]|uniref:hypothetical protein n=1 Tax=unclassified Streptomyces TaxID=2593676 RepID=UPI002250BC67|nr:hypothetical protein [Streptomyces sp. NBC_00452]MCX5056120.1 hypothetical protein [Streptomyces sp. NBC_00452]